MLTKDDLEQIAKLLEPLKKGQETLELKIETVHAFNKKAHTQIMDVLVESGEINYQELKKELKELKKRIEQLETRQQN